MNEAFRLIECPVCGGQSFKLVLETTPRDFLLEQRKQYYDLDALGIDINTKFHIRKCTACSFVFVNPRLRADLYNVVYNRAKVGQYAMNDWAFEHGDLQRLHNMYYKWGSALDFLGVVLYFRDRFRKAKNDGQRAIRLLDYGCGMGHLLDICKAFDVEGIGIDIDEFRIEQCRRKGHLVYRPEDLPAHEKFDIVLSSSVVEHVDDVNAYFGYIAERMLPKAIFRFNGLTPGIIRLEARKKQFREVMLLEHLNYFTPKSLSMMAAKHGLAKVGFINSVHAIEKPFQYLYPMLKNLVFRGFYPSGVFKADLVKT